MDWKKRAIGLLMVCCLAVTMLPTAFAVEEPGEEDAQQVQILEEKQETSAAAEEPALEEAVPSEETVKEKHASATTYTSGYWTYSLYSSSAAIIKYTGSASDISIPTTVTHGGITYKITELGSSLFEGKSSLKTVTIPEYVTDIGECAFKNCTNLRKITINAKNLNDCSSSSDGPYYGSASVFYNAGTNSSSFDVVFGSSVHEIPAYLFCTAGEKSDNHYAHITSVTIPNSVTVIGMYAFQNCFDLKTISWGNGITAIGDYAFNNCYKITNATIPTGVTYIGEAAFSDCRELTTINYNAKNANDCSSRSDGPYYDSASIFYNAGLNSSSLAVTFGSTVKEIPAYLFCTSGDYNYGDGDYAHITSMTIPSSVTVIRNYAFKNCYDLKSIKFLGSCPTIREYAFQNITTTAYYPNTWTSVPSSTAYGAKKITWTKTGSSTVAVTGISLNKTSLSLTVGNSATLTATIKPSNATNKTVTWTSSNTSVAKVSNGKVTGLKAGTATITAKSNNGKTATCKVTISTAVEKIFTDVTTSAWYYSAVQYVYDNNLMVGTSPSKFSPSVILTRAQVAQILYNRAGTPTVSGKAKFTDVKRGTWYYNAVQWTAGKGYVSGYGNGKFGPNDVITHEQFAVILYNYAGKPSTSGSIGFADANKVSSWAKTAVTWAYKKGYYNNIPFTDNKLKPQSGTTRAETAMILKNYFG